MRIKKAVMRMITLIRMPQAESNLDMTKKIRLKNNLKTKIKSIKEVLIKLILWNKKLKL